MFQTGEKVLCIKGATAIDGEILKEGKIYTILDTSYCKCEQFVYVGIKANRPTRCYKCRTKISNNNWWHFSHRFIRLEDSKYMDELINELMKEVLAPA